MATDPTSDRELFVPNPAPMDLLAMYRQLIPVAVEAIEDNIRRQVAAEIRAEHERIRPRDMRQFDGLVGMASSGAYENAARIAEGKGDET